tara:strand:- start:169 stop:708 length:540 start_codon:yes stop_codon:yes gene_type:complete
MVGESPGVTLADFEDWILGLEPWGEGCRRRALCAIARAALRVFDPKLLPVPQREYGSYPERAVRAFEDWILCPCEQHEQSVRTECSRAIWVAPHSESPDLEDPMSPTPLTAVAWIAHHLLFCMTPRQGMYEDIISWAKVANPEDLLSAVKDDLVPWALGYGDPLRERVEVRQRAEAAGG